MNGVFKKRFKKAPLNPACQQSLIRESISELADIDQAEGYLGQAYDNYGGTAGLIEFLYPWTVAGFISQLNASDVTPELQSKREDLFSQLATLEAKNLKRYKDYEEGLFDKTVYKSLTQESKTLEAKITADLAKTDKDIQQAATASTLTVDDFQTLDRMNHRTYTALLKNVIDHVSCYADRIDLHLVENPDKPISFPRVKIRNARQLPTPVIELCQQDPKTKKLTGKIRIVYHYPKGAIQEGILYQRGNITVETEEDS